MARPPPDRGGEPEPIEFGIPVVDDRLEDAGIDFPADRAELEATLGPVEIPYDAAGRTVRLGNALRELDQTTFTSKHELLDALHPVFEAHRQRTSRGLLTIVRSVLPF